ncbi:methyl-accepting chemotaxis protein [Vibrio brasiliensis]|mgnify:CR=1 FL=1|uniref:Methyl-accepting chemotaxis protein n=1 Tax=Vibrio brasiliensis LMG 20546 TaxID=945543 RepID=E8LSY3_9VIBR|nr:methyl-accepting chemotaxis protein [Vibrio brasiliensis]EGA66176.1 methyl-accepting chemotaxis protein [Vibrio brasiliensis LMG 20546]MCG9648361.1 methyl-accepting chemotaxis protein [Vibrio brasiliensis]
MSESPEKQRFTLSLSIRMKLILINLTLLVGVGIYAYYEQTSLNRLASLEHAASENLSSSVDLLMLRRHEKDFLARRDSKYIGRFDTTFEQLSQRIVDLQQTLASQQLNLNQQESQIVSTLDQYQSQFHQLAQLVNQINGKDSSTSLSSQLSTDRLELKQVVNQQQDQVLKVTLLELLESDLSYLASPSEESIALFQQSLTRFASRQLPDEIIQGFVQYQQSANAHIEAIEKLGLTSSLGLRGSLRANVHKTEQAIADLQGQIDTAIEAATVSIKNQLHMIGGAIVVLLSGLLFLIGRSILSRIKAINRLMQQIASGNGDLTVRMNAKGNDELATLANSFDLFISSLHGHIKDLAQVMGVLSESSCSSEQSALKSMKNAEQQKLESESVATAVNELVMTTNEITANIESAASNAQHVTNEAKNALELTHATGKRIDSLAESIEDSQAQIIALEEQSREINQVIATIQGIAEQTNLLALNAAIEAARAGESGRGFAVVADEVRQLSHLTNSSTQQIESTIQGLTHSISNTAKTMQTSAEQARTTNHHTHHVVEAIEQINAQVSEMFDMNTQIATASEEQSMVSTEIDRNITEIAHLANDTYQVVSGSVRCSEQVSGVSHKLERIVAQFKY